MKRRERREAQRGGVKMGVRRGCGERVWRGSPETHAAGHASMRTKLSRSAGSSIACHSRKAAWEKERGEERRGDERRRSGSCQVTGGAVGTQVEERRGTAELGGNREAVGGGVGLAARLRGIADALRHRTVDHRRVTLAHAPVVTTRGGGRRHVSGMGNTVRNPGDGVAYGVPRIISHAPHRHCRVELVHIALAAAD